MVNLFFSYSHRDEELRDQLETHLAMLKRQGFIETWHDRRITAGKQIDTAIDANLETAGIVLLLVSPDFLASDYCYEREMARAIERHKAGLSTVIPVILRPCDWHDATFGNLLAAPKDGKPITQWTNIDAAFLDVTTAIKGALRAKRQKVSPSRSLDPPPSSAPRSTEPRSSNLRVAKRYTKGDKEAFLHDAFEFMAKFFENSLQELAQRNPNIQARFRRIDANRFTAVAYRDGDAVARCGITLGGGFGSDSIQYSHDDSRSSNSFNESLSVESDDHFIFLKALGMSTLGRTATNDISKLTPEGGSELYWGMFVEPLQRGQRR